MGRISCAQTYGPMPSLTGLGCITPPPPHAVITDTPARLIDPNFHVDAHHQYRFVFGDLICFPLQDHERLWKFGVKNDIGFYVGDEDSVKGGSLIYMPYTHNVLTRGNGHRILISDIQLLQWYSHRRNIRRNPLPYSVVKDTIMDLRNPGNEVRDNPAPHNPGRHQGRSRHRTTDTCHHTTCCPIHRHPSQNWPNSQAANSSFTHTTTSQHPTRQQEPHNNHLL